MENTKEENEICLACGRCCHYMTFVLHPAPKDFKEYVEFYEARGCMITMLATGIAVTVKSLCPHLKWINLDHVCDIYEKRPELCRKYDGRLDPFFRKYCQLTKG